VCDQDVSVSFCCVAAAWSTLSLSYRKYVFHS
jgi:hypothetical protein